MTHANHKHFLASSPPANTCCDAATANVAMCLNSILSSTAVIAICLLVAYAYQINALMSAAPRDANYLAGEPLTAETIKATRERLQKQPINYEKFLPKKKDRRYIVVGGSGLVGGQLVLDLLHIGTPPAAIRIIDINDPIRAKQFSKKPASNVSIIHADVASSSAVDAAFTAPWPSSTQSLPLTVFHTVALIRPFERHQSLYHRSATVNVIGTANVLQAARAAKAQLMIYTSSSTVEHLPVDFFPRPSLSSRPFLSLGSAYAQILSAADFALPLRTVDRFACNYARSKAEAERLVNAADGENGMRTGIIRPGNAVYGHPDDKVLGRMLAMGSLPSFGANWAQSWIGVRNASLAHLQFENALLGSHAPKLAGKAFLVTDDGPPLRLGDVHKILNLASTNGLRVTYPPPLLMLLGAYIVETWALAVTHAPYLAALLGEPRDPVILFQPAVFSVAVSAAVDDSTARKPPEEGGLGYKSACTSLEGMITQAAAHGNEWSW
ncbi:3-beta hydroxysteroid dehydrogenase/isomerase family protein [Sarocladium implicatum]|nr:3-beta hydroxysteroid dehydrogenase/isomerase family protein [Sarocladium implicatum]